MGVEIRQPINHRLRLLGGRRIVQPDQGFAPDLFIQDGKILTDSHHIEWQMSGIIASAHNISLLSRYSHKLVYFVEEIQGRPGYVGRCRLNRHGGRRRGRPRP